ncbi:MAG: polysaccharide deacetylase family protein [Desulfobacteraceae bacterium]|nr:polysaccharide deacetylase family protein [Desulfobacteraceae bacterium]
MKFSLGSQILGEVRSVLYGYPDFVFSGRSKDLKNGIPVFVYHTIDPGQFEADLIFLKENGYRTLSMDGFISILNRKGALPEKSVLLTVDDGRSSFWRYGFPLLEKYGMKATLFVNPGWVLDAGACRKSLKDVWNGDAKLHEIDGLDPGDTILCTWPELRAVLNSGVVNIESHTLFHKEIFINDRIVDFIDDKTSFVPYCTPVTAWLTPDDIGKSIIPEKYYGLPLMMSAPLMQGLPGLKIPEAVKAFCTARYAGRPCKDDNNAWKKALFHDLKRSGLLNGIESQDAEAIFKDVRQDLSIARDIIQHKLGPDAGNHLCIPYSMGSSVAEQAAISLGIKSCFLGVRAGKRINSPGDGTLRIVRLKHDFLHTLPGIGRKKPSSVYWIKVYRRLRRISVY